MTTGQTVEDLGHQITDDGDAIGVSIDRWGLSGAQIVTGKAFGYVKVVQNHAQYHRIKTVILTINNGPPTAATVTPFIVSNGQSSNTTSNYRAVVPFVLKDQTDYTYVVCVTTFQGETGCTTLKFNSGGPIN